MKLQGSEVQDHKTLQSQIGKIAENRLPFSGLEIFSRPTEYIAGLNPSLAAGLFGRSIVRGHLVADVVMTNPVPCGR